MGKLPSAVLRRPSALVPHSSPHSCPSSSSSTTSQTPFLAGHRTTTPTTPTSSAHHQVRHATFIPRVRRPYTFTQLVQLSDGSTFTVRTTSPHPLYRSAKDTRNHIMWQPSEKSLRNVEVDEAGKLAAFRERFGRSWDLGGGAAAAEEAETKAAASPGEGVAAKSEVEAAIKEVEQVDALGDLISSYAASAGGAGSGGLSAKQQAKADKGKKKK